VGGVGFGGLLAVLSRVDGVALGVVGLLGGLGCFALGVALGGLLVVLGRGMGCCAVAIVDITVWS